MDRNKTIQELLEIQVQRHPRKCAVIAGPDSITYRQLHTRSNIVMHSLIDTHKLKKGDIIGLHIENSIDLIVVLLAILKLGAAYLPLDCNYPQARKLRMLQDSEVNLLVHSNNTGSLIFSNSISVGELNAYSSKGDADTSRIYYDLDDHLYSLYTSGSTGHPKGVKLRQAGVMNMLHWYVSQYEMSSNDTNLVFSSFGYDLTQKNILSALLCGATLVVQSSQIYSPKEIIENIRKYKVTIINCTPSAFYPLLDQINDVMQLQSLRWIFLGGEKINCKRLKTMLKLYPNTKIVNTYGPTECSDVACAYTLNKNEIELTQEIPLGTPIDNVGVYVLDQALNPLSTLEKGEVYLSGHCLGDGYINQPELTKKKFIDTLPKYFTSRNISRLYRVGDLGYWDIEGRLNFIGRVDDQIKLRGNRVELSEIDRVVEKTNAISHSVTVLIDSNDNQILVSFYLQGNNQVDQRRLKKHVSEFLPDYMIPNKFIQLDNFPVTPNGKIDKSKLKKIAEDHLVLTATKIV